MLFLKYLYTLYLYVNIHIYVNNNLKHNVNKNYFKFYNIIYFISLKFYLLEH